jgi:hypothetical protein
VPRSTDGHGAGELLARQEQAADLVGQDAPRFRALQVQDDLGDAEHAHRDRDEADAVRELRHAEGEALLAGLHIVPTRPSATPSTTMPMPLITEPCASTAEMIRPSSMSEK